jgi:hypothetical protein
VMRGSAIVVSFGDILPFILGIGDLGSGIGDVLAAL